MICISGFIYEKKEDSGSRGGGVSLPCHTPTPWKGGTIGLPSRGMPQKCLSNKRGEKGTKARSLEPWVPIKGYYPFRDWEKEKRMIKRGCIRGRRRGSNVKFYAERYRRVAQVQRGGPEPKISLKRDWHQGIVGHQRSRSVGVWGIFLRAEAFRRKK